MKLTNLLEDEENTTIVIPMLWLTREERKEKFIRNGYQLIPIAGYRETLKYRAYKIIGPYTKDSWAIRNLSMPIWEPFTLTARYACSIEKSNSTTGKQMFDHLDDDEKIQSLKENWYPCSAKYIKKYFKSHPELLERARHSLNIEEIDNYFKELFL